MSANNMKLRTAVRGALLSLATAPALVPFAAHAEDDDATKLDRVEVTGSRIKRTQLEGAMPVTSVSREDIEKTGINSIGDLLQELPAAGAALNTNFNNGGDGTTQIDLRNLGSNRVLVLVNGRRWVNITGGASAVDLNTIPIAIIERIEVLKDGASAVYGSDAIAGVVNIITRKDYDGMAANATIGEFDEGDGRQEAYDFSVGSSGSRSSVFFNASYFDAETVAAGDRNISKEPQFRLGNAAGSITTPMGRVLIPDGGLPFSSAFGGTRDTGGDSTPTAGDYRVFDVNADAYNFAPDNYLATPSERWAIYAQGRYDLTDNVTFTTEALYNKRISEQLLAAMPVTVGSQGGIRADGVRVGIDATNPYNFFGVNLDPVAANPGLNLVNISRRFVETGGRSFNQDTSTYRFGAGLEGNFEMVGRVWDWNLNYTYSQTTQMNVTYGLLNTSRMRNALGPVAACTAPCVPMNLFGGVGSISQAMLDYVTFNAHDNLGATMRDYSGNLSGEIFDLPAGPLGLALGYEYRQEEGFDDPDALIAAGNTTGNARSPTGGKFSLSEFYTEIAIPVLKDAPFAEDLELQVAFRSSDYDTFGSTTNTKFGLRWQPFTDLLVRATFQEGFRAPNIAELFLGQSDAFPNLIDPCSVPAGNGGTSNFGGLDPTPDTQAEAQLLANCTGTAVTGAFSATPNPNVPAAVQVPANGFVAGSMYSQGNQQIRITVGGNPNLNPETAESTTFGFVYSPSYLDGLSVTLDWYEIQLDDAIAGIGSAAIMNGCYVGGDTGLCNLIERNAIGFVDDLFSGSTNLASFTVAGVDLNVVYRAGELPFLPGEWKFTWDTSFVDDWSQCTPDTTTPSPSDEVCVDFVQFNIGDGSIPAFKSNLEVDWSWGDWEATWRMRFIGRQYENCSAPTLTSIASTKFWGGAPPAGWTYCSNPTASTNALGATTYHSVQVSYNISDWDTRFTFGIQNIGDKSPPVSTQAFANSFDATTYEIPGRFPYIRISKTF